MDMSQFGCRGCNYIHSSKELIGEADLTLMRSGVVQMEYECNGCGRGNVTTFTES